MQARLGFVALSVAVAALLLAAYAALYEVRTYDTLFHLAAGRYIVDHAQLPDRDPFSFTFRGTPWVNHSSGFQLLLALLHAAGGFALVSIYQAAIAVLLCGLAITRLRNAPAPELMLGAALAALPYCAFREVLEARPHVLGYLCLAGTLAVVLHAHATERIRSLGWVVPLYAAWAACHGSHLLVFAVITAGAVARREPRWLGAYAALAASCLALMGWLAPWALTQGLEHAGSLFLESAVTEWLPLTAADVFGSWPGRTFALLWAATLVGLALELRRERLRPPALHALALLVPLMLLALSSRRMIALFAFGAAPLWLPYAVAAFRWLARPRLAASLSAATLLACLAAAIAQADTFRSGAGLQSDRFPIAAVTAMRSSGRVQRLYNAYNFGGYLMFAGVPARGVFVDGRAITLYPADFLGQFQAAYANPRDFERLAERYACDAVLLPVRSAVASGLRAHLLGSTSWRLTHRDDVAELYERATSLTAERR